MKAATIVGCMVLDKFAACLSPLTRDLQPMAVITATVPIVR